MKGARRFNGALDQGSANMEAGDLLLYDLEDYFEEEDREYRDPELCDPKEETLPSGGVELIFENC